MLGMIAALCRLFAESTPSSMPDDVGEGVRAPLSRVVKEED